MQMKQTQETIAIAPFSVIEEMNKRIESLHIEISKISSLLSERENSKEIILPPAPETTKVTISELASIVGVCKQTIFRWIKEEKLPVPKITPHNGYKFFYKKDLPEDMHSKIDIFYFKANSSR